MVRGELYPCHPDLQVKKRQFFQARGISDADKAAVKEFVRRQEALGVGDKRIRKIFSNLKTILTVLYPGFSLTKATEKDIIELSARIRASKYSDRTKEDFHIVVRRFYKVMEGRNARYPEKLDFFKTPKRVKTTKGVKDIISRQELEALIGASKTVRDKAILMVLYEGGMRAGELLNLDVQDVKVVDDGVEIHVPDKPGCKTGPRDIWLVECYGRVRDYRESHPFKDNPTAPFWLKSHQGTKRPQTRVDVYTLYQMLKERATKAGLDVKKIHPHAFRHTCATEKAVLGFSEAQLNQFMGWTQGSKMAGVYIHMSKEGVKEAYRKALGMPAVEEGDRSSRLCPKCGYLNSFKSHQCARCFTVIDPKARAEIQEVEAENVERLARLDTLEQRLKSLERRR